MTKANYKIPFGRQEASRLKAWKEAVARGERMELTPEQMKEQAEYRKKMKALGRNPKSYEMRMNELPVKKQMEAKKKIKRLQTIKKVAEPWDGTIEVLPYVEPPASRTFGRIQGKKKRNARGKW